MKTFSAEMKAARAKAGLTQGQAAALLDVARNTVTRWEMGLLIPRPLTRRAAIAALAEAQPKRSKRQ